MTRVFAPGRVELLGNHTDYNAGVVLSAALDLGIAVSGELTNNGRIVLSSEGFAPVEVAADEELRRSGEWSDYALGVVATLRAMGVEVPAFRAHYASTLPPGAGLSSSAAMEVGTAVLLRDLLGLKLSALEIAKLGRRAENEFVGVGCGLLDQVSSVFGRKQQAIYLDCRAESVERIPFPAGVDLLIVQSGVAHALKGGEYDERRAQCFEAARLLGVPALRDVTSAQLAAAQLPDLVGRRAAHIVGENERVLAAVEYLRAGDAAAFGRLMTASHESSRRNFENSTPQLDLLVEFATAQPGVFGARLTGGGFGGAIVATVASEALDSARAGILSAYEERTGIATQAIVCHPGAGAVADA